MTATRRISKIIKDGIEYNIVGGGSEAVDTCLDTTSENPVQNKVIAQAINGKQDALTAGPNVCIYEENDELKICATDTTYTNATQSSDGLMSASDKKKLDSLTPGGLKIGLVDFLIVGGGGGGGGYVWSCCSNAIGGGGGGGGVIYCQNAMIYGGDCNIVVGSGGASNQDGGYSCGFGVTASGGGKGGSSAYKGGNGGSGGGGGGCTYCNCSLGYGCGTSGQGCNGGAYQSCCSGGGGGAGGAATTGTYGGAGGNGRSISISGTAVYYGAGGGGTKHGSGCGGTGGTGGGGNGATTCDGCPGTGYGAGGGGAKTSTSSLVMGTGGKGGNGIVIVRYKKDGSSGIVNATGGCKYECGDYCIHCFTSSGTFVPFN